MQANLYTVKGVKSGTIKLPNIFDEKENKQLLSQAIHVYRARQHGKGSKTLRRGEIALTTKKWYRQKGTGNARHGARSAPLFVGGGKAHGPKGIKRVLSLPKKAARKALWIALSEKANERKIVVVKNLSTLTKTKETHNLIEKIKKSQKYGDKTKFTFALNEDSWKVNRYIRNINKAKSRLYKNLNAHSVFFGGVLAIDSEVLKKPKKQIALKK